MGLFVDRRWCEQMLANERPVAWQTFSLYSGARERGQPRLGGGRRQSSLVLDPPPRLSLSEFARRAPSASAMVGGGAETQGGGRGESDTSYELPQLRALD